MMLPAIALTQKMFILNFKRIQVLIMPQMVYADYYYCKI